MTTTRSVSDRVPGNRAVIDQRGPDTDFEEKRGFILALGEAAHNYGVSSHRLESYLRRVSGALRIDGTFMFSPDEYFGVLQHTGGRHQSIHVARLPDPSFDMSKLAQVGKLVDALAAGAVSVQEATIRLGEIALKQPIYGLGVIGFGYALCGATFAVLLSAGWENALLAAVLSQVVFANTWLASKSRWILRTQEISSAAAVSVLANIAGVLHPGIDPFIVTLCALIVMIPGFSLTLGVAELTSEHVNSGAKRLIGGLLTTFRLFIGATLGSVLASHLLTVPPAVSSAEMAPVWTWLSVVSLVAGLSLTFQVRPSDVIWAVLGGVGAYAGVVAGGSLVFWQGSFIGAFILGVYAPLYSWHFRLPSSVVMLPAVMVLVPGASAYRGLQTLTTDGVASGLSDEWHVLANILAIIAGLYTANTVFPPRSAL